jgi:trans-aconitate 2-methyltransferase
MSNAGPLPVNPGHEAMTHEFDGRRYALASAHQKEWGAKLIAELQLRGTERILDLGCGDGALTAQLAEIVPAGSVVGIDSSQGMIDVARQKQTDNLRFVLMDIAQINYDKQFDVVFSNATLHWVRDHQRLYRDVRRALRPGGMLRFNFAGEGNCSHFFAVIREAMLLDRFFPYFDGFQWPWYMPAVSEYEALVGSGGLREVRVWGENADRFFPDAQAMIQWIDQPSLVPFLPCVAEGDRSRFRDHVVGRMLETTRQPDGRHFETFRRVNVFARE